MKTYCYKCEREIPQAERDAQCEGSDIWDINEASPLHHDGHDFYND